MRNTIIVLTLLALASLGMGFIAGRASVTKTEITNNYIEQPEPLTEWEILKLAIIRTESEFNPLAVGTHEDRGIYQIVPVYVEEVNRILGEDRYLHEEAFNPHKADEMFELYQGEKNPSHDIDRAIILHNPTATAEYSIKVRKAMDWIRNYETIRTAIQ